MSTREFIRSNRAEIDRMILEELYRHDGNGGRGTIPEPPPRFNDEERLEWIENYEPLYCWARSERVPV